MFLGTYIIVGNYSNLVNERIINISNAIIRCGKISFYPCKCIVIIISLIYEFVVKTLTLPNLTEYLTKITVYEKLSHLLKLSSDYEKSRKNMTENVQKCVFFDFLKVCFDTLKIFKINSLKLENSEEFLEYKSMVNMARSI